MILRKENATVREENESRIKELKALGYVEVDEKGKSLEAEKEKTVAESTHKKVLKENKDLKEQVAALEGQVQEKDNTIKELEEEIKKASK